MLDDQQAKKRNNIHKAQYKCQFFWWHCYFHGIYYFSPDDRLVVQAILLILLFINLAISFVIRKNVKAQTFES